MLKDLNLALDAGAKGGLVPVGETLPMGARAKALYESVCDSGRGGKDFGAVYDFLRALKP